MPDLVRTCTECEAPATWFRCTQFAGTHPYCEVHARAEKDFGQDAGHYFAWRTLQQLQEGEARVKAEQAAAAAEAAKVSGSWARVTCLDGQPCSEGLTLERHARMTGKAPAVYRLTFTPPLSRHYPTEIRFRTSGRPEGWTHQHLILVLINRLTALQELKPSRMRGLALDGLLGALTYLTAPEDAKITGGADEVVALRAQVKELETQLAEARRKS
jgi:hypothetical protein